MVSRNGIMEVIKVNPATYKVTFSDGQTLNMKKAEVFADDLKEPKAVTTPDIPAKVLKDEPAVTPEVKPEVTPKAKAALKSKPKVLTAKDIKENYRVSVYWPKDKQSYNATVRKIKKGGWYELAYDDGKIHNERFDKKKWKLL
jgi:hypothetical protein